jgi:2-dehydropantoate 2-reductase
VRICIYGAGSVGGYIAARLAKAGRDVSVVARGAHLAAIRERGLTLVTPEERFTVTLPADEDPAKLGRQDLVIIATKTPALPQVAERIGPMLGPDSQVVFAVNGVFWFYGHGFAPGAPIDTSRLDRDGTLARLIGPGRALGMVIYSPNAVPEPGVVENGGKINRFVLGAPAAGDLGRAERAVAALDGAGFGIELSPQIRREMWQKLSRNVSSSPVCALTGALLDRALGSPGLRMVAVALMTEALAVAHAHGFTDLGIDPEVEMAKSGKLPHKVSMLQDLELGRPMEIDSQLAIVQDLGRQAGVATPTLDALLPVLTLKAQLAGCYPV